MEMNRKKKVLSPIETGGDNGKPKRTFWMRVGTAFVNKDGSTNVYLDAVPKTMKLQLRDFDEPGTRSRVESDPVAAATSGVPF